MNIFNDDYVVHIAKYLPIKEVFKLQEISKNCNNKIVNFINSTLINTQQRQDLNSKKMSFNQLSEFYMKYHNINVIDFSNFYSENINNEKTKILFLLCKKITLLKIDNLNFDSKGNFESVKDNKFETINLIEILNGKDEIKEISIKNFSMKLSKSIRIMKQIKSLETIHTKSYTLKRDGNLKKLSKQIGLTNGEFLTSDHIKVIIAGKMENISGCKVAIKDRNDLAVLTQMLEISKRKDLISSITFLEGMTWNFPAQPLGVLLSLMESVDSIDFSELKKEKFLFNQKNFLGIIKGQPKKLIFKHRFPPEALEFEFFKNVEFLDFNLKITDDAIIKNSGSLQNLKTLSFVNHDEVFNNLVDSLLDESRDKKILFPKLEKIIVKFLNYENTDFIKVKELQKQGIVVRLNKMDTNIEISHFQPGDYTGNFEETFQPGDYTGNFEETKDITILSRTHKIFN